MLPEYFSDSAQTANFMPDLDFDKLELAIRTNFDRCKIAGVKPTKKENAIELRAAALRLPHFRLFELVVVVAVVVVAVEEAIVAEVASEAEG